MTNFKKLMAAAVMLWATSSVLWAADNELFSTHGLQGELLFDVSVHVLGEDTGVVDEAFKKKLTFTFPVIPGGIFGTPDKVQRTLHEVDENHQITLSVSEIIDTTKQKATELQSQFVTMGMELQPPSTRLARLGSFGDAQQDDFQIMGTAAFEKGTKNLLMLVYFDGQATLVGEVSEGGKLFKHQVNVPGAGLHWLRNKKTDENTYVIERVDHIKQVDLKVMVKPKEQPAD